MAPAMRIRRVRARVSIPSTPSLPCSSRNSFKVLRERQLLGCGWYSLTMNPSRWIFADSMSSGLIP